MKDLSVKVLTYAGWTLAGITLGTIYVIGLWFIFTTNTPILVIATMIFMILATVCLRQAIVDLS